MQAFLIWVDIKDISITDDGEFHVWFRLHIKLVTNGQKSWQKSRINDNVCLPASNYSEGEIFKSNHLRVGSRKMQIKAK